MPAAAGSGAPVGEPRRPALALAVLAAAAIHAWLLFGIRVHLHETPRAEVLEVSLVALAGGAPAPALPAPPTAPARPPAPIAPKPRHAPRAVPPRAAPETAPRPPEPLAAPAGEAATESAPGPSDARAALPEAGPGGGAPAPPGATSARPRYKSSPEPAYPASARRRRQEGVVLLAVRVAASGRPEAVGVRESSGFAALDAAAVAAVRGWEFEPGRTDGEPVPSQVEVPIHFELDPAQAERRRSP